ncbi:FAD dependent oxidoreductase [Trichocladium antarcticum]|uniref:FAD dependent oxidoreductase n=1 Tax=Trichocladium antarcticum TaxID=1450529 RepID=A0AAN6UHY7_9PEZI|nr:FAD dependent oxidoreductase [Trichocladium antarcticum]
MSSHTVILGAGIIGVSTAYYLAQHQDPSSIHLVEPSPELFSSASGYAGGFLASNWFAPSLAALGAFSFNEHRRLAQEHGGREKWGYSPATCVSYAASAAARDDQKRGDDWLRDGTSRADAAAPVVLDSSSEKTPAWLRRVDGDHLELISDETTAAQVDPLLLCRFLLQECVTRGVRLHHPAKPVSVVTDAKGELAAVRIVDTRSAMETELACAKLIVAAGSWTGQVFRTLFPGAIRIPIRSLAGHSLVLKSPRWHEGLESNGCHAIFTTHNAAFCPEMFARLGGHIYFAGLNSSELPVPDAAAGKATPSSEGLAQLREAAREILGSGAGGEDDLEIVREGLCFRPVTSWGTPIISRIRDQDLGSGVATRSGSQGGVFVAAGHGPWGIAMSLGTGAVLAELVQGRESSADISGLAFGGDRAKL